MANQKFGLGPRPRDFFGPEDWDGVTAPEELDAEIKQKQQEWDSKFQQLGWWKRLWHSLTIPSPP